MFLLPEDSNKEQLFSLITRNVFTILILSVYHFNQTAGLN